MTAKKVYRVSGDDTVGSFELPLPHKPTFVHQPRDVLEQLRGISGLSATVSDVLDEFGWNLAIPASRLALRTKFPSAIVGHAITIGYLPSRRSIHQAEHRSSPPQLVHDAALRLCLPGDILVIGAPDTGNVSAFGGLAALAAVRAKVAGCVIDAGIRDVGQIERVALPIWARTVTPRTGKWRLELDGVCKPIVCGGVHVRTGDLVLADSTGICFVPASIQSVVIQRVVEVARLEAELLDKADPRFS